MIRESGLLFNVLQGKLESLLSLFNTFSWFSTLARCNLVCPRMCLITSGFLCTKMFAMAGGPSKSPTYVILAISSFVLCSLLMIGLVLLVIGSNHIFLGISCGLVGAGVCGVVSTVNHLNSFLL